MSPASTAMVNSTTTCQTSVDTIPPTFTIARPPTTRTKLSSFTTVRHSLPRSHQLTLMLSSLLATNTDAPLFRMMETPTTTSTLTNTERDEYTQRRLFICSGHD